MRHTPRCIPLILLVAVSCKSGDKKPAPEPASEPASQPPATQPAPTEPPPAAPADPAATAPAAPEPTTPEEIDAARKNAMLAGKDADVIKYCEMAGIKGLGEGGKGDGQSQLGCALAACRLNQGDKAKAWAKGLPKPLKEQANKICLANKVVL